MFENDRRLAVRCVTKLPSDQESMYITSLWARVKMLTFVVEIERSVQYLKPVDSVFCGELPIYS